MLKIKVPPTNPSLPKRIISFGYRHHGPPRGAFDVRPFFINPFGEPNLRYRDGRDPEVGKFIEERTEGFAAKFQNLVEWAGLHPGETVYLGCFGGRHRSVFLAEKLGKLLGVPVEHWDLNREE